MVCWGGLFVSRLVRRGVGRVEKREERMGVVKWERKRVVVFVGVLSTLGAASPLLSGRKTGRNLSPPSPSTPDQMISQWAPNLGRQAAAPARRC